MKIKKISKYQNKLLKLKLAQSKIYNKKHRINNIKIETIQSRLKKAFHIIYKYHVLKKKILFIGTPLRVSKNLKKILKNTKHFLIPETIWMNGIITNKVSFFKHLSKNKKINNNKISEILFQFKKNIDLIVLLNEPSNINALNESYLSKIPIISLNSNLNIQNFKPNYKIPGDFQFFNKKIRDNFFYTIFIAVLKKKNRKRRSWSQNSYNKKNDFYKKKRFKPLYKKFIKARENVQNRKKLLKFKKKKWEILIKTYKRTLKRYKKFKPKTQNQYLVSKYPNRGTSFKKNYRNTLQTLKKFKLFCGDSRKNVIKKKINKIIKKKIKIEMYFL